MKITLTGRVHSIGELETINDKLVKRLLVMTIPSDEKETFYAVDLTNNNARKAEDVKPGDAIEINTSLSSREWKGKYFTSLFCMGYKILTSTGTVVPAEDALESQLNSSDDEEVPF